MENISRVGVDFIFCSIVAFLIIQGSNATQPDRNTMELFQVDLTQIGIDSDRI